MCRDYTNLKAQHAAQLTQKVVWVATEMLVEIGSSTVDMNCPLRWLEDMPTINH